MPKKSTKTSIPGSGKGTEILDAPGELRRLLRFGKLAVPGAAASADDVFRMLILDLQEVGISDEALAKIQDIGPDFLRSGKVPQSVVKLIGDKDTTKRVKASLDAARAATKTVSTASLNREFKDLVRVLEREGLDPRVVQELKQVGPKRLAEIGSRQTISALSSRPDETTVQRLYRNLLKKPAPPAIADGIKQTLASVEGGTAAPVTGATRKGLTQAGVKGVGGLAQLGRFATGVGALATAAFTIPRVVGAFGKGQRARDLASQGFGALGPQSSAEFLKGRVAQQEAITRRRLVLQQFHPELFQDVIQSLSTAGLPPSSLTTSERRIGQPQGGGFQTRRSPKDIQFLLDQLLSQMGA